VGGAAGGQEGARVGGRESVCVRAGRDAKVRDTFGFLWRVPGFHPDCRSAAAVHSAVRATPLWRSRVRVSPGGLLSVAARSTHTLRLHH